MYCNELSCSHAPVQLITSYVSLCRALPVPPLPLPACAGALLWDLHIVGAVRIAERTHALPLWTLTLATHQDVITNALVKGRWGERMKAWLNEGKTIDEADGK